MSVQVDWAQFKADNDPQERQRLLEQYIPLVKNVAGRMAMGFPKSVELSDLVNTGVIGLIEAMSNFDPERGVKFETYAVPRIRGAILDELRSLDWVPRSTRAKSREIDRAGQAGKRAGQASFSTGAGKDPEDIHRRALFRNRRRLLGHRALFGRTDLQRGR
jgi:RNA polymerase sigma factor for flagellar operon FliA